MTVRFPVAACLLCLSACGSSGESKGSSGNPTSDGGLPGGISDTNGGEGGAGAVPVLPKGTICTAKAQEPFVEDRRAYASANQDVIAVEIVATDTAALIAVNDGKPGAKAAISFRHGGFESAATLELRGRSTRESLQKSYKINLAGATTWRDQKTIHLNKHPYDLTRVRNRLAMTYFQSLPHMTSLRTEYASLTMNGKNLGLFELTETPSKPFLTRHGLDASGLVYKANEFEFLPLDDKFIKDDKALSDILEIKVGKSDHKKLQNMLKAINDETVDINCSVEQYFHRDNYLSWLASNVIFDEVDTITQNFMLYSPTNSNTWYFLPWDYDGSWGFLEQPDQIKVIPRMRWEGGIARYWSIPFHRRFLRDPKNRADLIARMGEMMKIVTPARTREILAAAHPIIRRFVEAPPDRENLPTANYDQDPAAVLPRFEAEFARLVDSPARSIALFNTTNEWPLPMWTDVNQQGAGYEVTWDPSFDFQGDSFHYDIAVGRTPDLATRVFEKKGLTETSLVLPKLPSGTYFLRVVVREDKNSATHWQTAFDAYWDEKESKRYPGTRKFVIH